MADSKTRVRTYAPGYGLFIPKSSAAGKQDCPGCDVGEASPWCAACGKPTAVVLPPIQVGVSEGHALPLCIGCYDVLLAVSTPERAQEIRREVARAKKREYSRRYRAKRKQAA